MNELQRIQYLIHKSNSRVWRRYDRFMQREGWKENFRIEGEWKVKFRPLVGDQWHLYREAVKLQLKLYRKMREVRWRSSRPEIAVIEESDVA